MSKIDQKWTSSRIDDSRIGLTDRIARLDGWFREACHESSDLPSETTMQAADENWNTIVNQLTQAYAQAQHPLSGVELIAWTKAKSLTDARLALLARQFAPPQPKKGLLFFKKAPPTRSYSAVAALATLRQAFLAYAFAYRPAPRGFWSLAHAMFERIAPKGGYGDISAPGATSQPGVDTYRKLLVYALANPHGFRVGYLSIAIQILDYFSPLARFLDAVPVQDTARGLVVVALDSDQMPRAISRAEPAEREESMLYIQLHDLTYEMQQTAESLLRGKALPLQIDGAVAITRREISDVLQTILRSFAGISARAIPRVPATGPVELVTGFYPAWTMLTTPDDSGEKPNIHSANVVNQTISGIAFQLEHSSEARVRVGEIVLFRRPTQPLWKIGVIRWLEIGARDAMIVGCQALGLRSDAYLAIDQDGQDIPIIVAQVPNHVGDTTVLVPDQGADTDTQLTTKDGLDHVHIVLTDLRESHIDCARFQFLTV